MYKKRGFCYFIVFLLFFVFCFLCWVSITIWGLQPALRQVNQESLRESHNFLLGVRVGVDRGELVSEVAAMVGKLMIMVV